MTDADNASHWFSQRDPELVPAASGNVSISPSRLPEVVTVSPVMTLQKLRDIAETRHLANDGDAFEQAYWPAINEHFPNYERFWQHFVVPMTKRIEIVEATPERIEPGAALLTTRGVLATSTILFSCICHMPSITYRIL